ncbi:MAG: FecR domain-containing protein [Clostridia bacterium]|jgi:hypothetical protein|nr:FecR domain-containing protein [Clostridia bacterium]
MKRIRTVLILTLILSLLLPAMPLVAADTLKAAKIVSVTGDVKVLRAGGERLFPAFQGMGLTKGDTVVTGGDGKAAIDLDPDKELIIAPNSKVMISELIESLETNTDQTLLNLKAGQVYINVKKPLTTGSKYEIKTSTAVMGVRGTKFFVNLSGGGQAEIVTLEGVVTVSIPQTVTGPDGTPLTQMTEIRLEPNQMFVQTGEGTGQYDLTTLTGNTSLSLFVLETLQQISSQQPDLIKPELLQNLEQKIEQARQQEQQRQQQLQQQEEDEANSPGIDYGSGAGDGTGNRRGGNDNQNDEDEDEDEDDEDEDEDEDGDGEAVENGWVKSVITSIGSHWYPWGETDIAVDSDGMPHVIYTAGSIKYRYWDGSSWQDRGFQSGTSRGALTIEQYEDGQNRIHVSCADGGRLGYSMIEEGGGLYHSFGSEEAEVEGSAIAVLPYYNDYSGVVGISYYDGTGGDLRFRFDTDTGDVLPDTWSNPIHVAGVESDAGKYSSLAFTGEGQVLIAYYDDDGETGSLKLAAIADPWEAEPQIELMDIDAEAGGNVGQYVSLALDSEGQPHLAYYDESNGGLKYATNPTLQYIEEEWNIGDWQIDIVDTVGDVGQYASLALDNGGKPHISYYDATNEDLKYAANTDGAWQLTLVDSKGDAGRYSAIAIEPANNVPQIAYMAQKHHWASYKVKYAAPLGFMNKITPAAITNEIRNFSGDMTISYASYGSGLYFMKCGEYTLKANEPDDFDISTESKTITFKKNYLNSLGVGTHKIKILFANNGLPAVLTINITDHDHGIYTIGSIPIPQDEEDFAQFIAGAVDGVLLIEATGHDPLSIVMGSYDTRAEFLESLNSALLDGLGVNDSEEPYVEAFFTAGDYLKLVYNNHYGSVVPLRIVEPGEVPDGYDIFFGDDLYIKEKAY